MTTRRAFGALITTTLFQPLASATEKPETSVALAPTRLNVLRRLDLNPSWFNAMNWGNRQYDPWTDYISGEISEAQFNTVCQQTSDYCLRDIWNLQKESINTINWSTTPPNWNGIHALALRFYRSGKPIYLHKWSSVILNYLQWVNRTFDVYRVAKGPSQPSQLLDLAFAWGGLFTALSIVAKGLDSTKTRDEPLKQSPFDPVTSPLSPIQAALLPKGLLEAVCDTFARHIASHLVEAYIQPKFAPNQRMFGLEAAITALTIFSDDTKLKSLRPTLDEAIQDVATRYRQVDGGQLEQSFNYARDLIDGLTRISKLPLDPVASWKATAENAILGWRRFSQAIMMPQGGMPQVGNSAAGRVGTDRDLRFSVPSLAFPYSGMYCIRSNWTREAVYLFFFSRRAARGHSMAGSNSIQFHALGRMLLVPGGSADYRPISNRNRDSAIYLSESSTWKTNSILIDGLSQAEGSVAGLFKDHQGRPDITRGAAEPLQNRWLSSREVDYLEGWHSTGYRSSTDLKSPPTILDAKHWRQIVFLRSMGITIVVDHLFATGLHRYSQVWKFAPPGPSLSNDGFHPSEVSFSELEQMIHTTDDRPDATNLAMWQCATERIGYSKYFGESGYGYFNRGPLSEPQPSVDVHAEWSGEGAQTSITILFPHKGRSASLEKLIRESARGVTRCGWQNSAGTRVSIVTSHSPTMLEGLATRAQGANLLMELLAPGRKPISLVIGPDRSWLNEGAQKEPVMAPSSFRWQEDADGLLRPAYS